MVGARSASHWRPRPASGNSLMRSQVCGAIGRHVGRSGERRSPRPRPLGTASGGSKPPRGPGVPIHWSSIVAARQRSGTICSVPSMARRGSTAQPLHLAIAAVGAARELREGLEQLGWRVTTHRCRWRWLEPVGRIDRRRSRARSRAGCSAPAAPDRHHRVARRRCREWLGRPWFDEFDVVISSTDVVADEIRHASAKVATPLQLDPSKDLGRSIRSALVTWAASTRYGLRVGVPNWGVTERWGDYHFARAVQRSLERVGPSDATPFPPGLGGSVAAREDVAVHLFGLGRPRPGRYQVNMLWQISHPDLATPGPL